jgi:hypothetical protein
MRPWMSGEVPEMSWITKQELTASRQISPYSADHLIRRRGWQRRPAGDAQAECRPSIPTHVLALRPVTSIRAELAGLRQDMARLIERIDSPQP